MADQKVTALSENTTVATTDMLYLVDDPAGTPASEKATVANVVLAGMVDIGARVYNSGELTIGTASWTALTFDSERWDTDTIHSTVANTSRLTATTAGTYLIVSNVQWDYNGAGQRITKLMVGGATEIARVAVTNADASDRENLICTTIHQLAAAEYVETYVYQNSGGNLGVEVRADSSPEFMMQRIG